MTQIEVLRQRLRESAIKTERYTDTRVVLQGFGEDTEAVFVFVNPENEDFEDLLEGCSLQVWITDTRSGEEEKARRAGVIKREVMKGLVEVGVLERERERWRDLEFFTGMISWVKMGESAGKHRGAAA